MGPRGAAPRGGRRASGPPPTNQLKPPREAEAANAYPCHTVPSPGLRAPPPMTPLELTCPAVEQTSRTGQLPPLFATAHARGGFRRPPPLASSKLVGSGGVQQRGELRQLHDGRGGGAATQGAQQGQEGRSLLPLLLPRGIAWLTARERPRATQRMRLPSGVRSRRPRAPPRGEGGAGRRSPPPPPSHHPRGSSTARAPAPRAPDSPTWVATRGRRPPVSVPLKAAFFNANEQLFADHVVSPRRRGRAAHL